MFLTAPVTCQACFWSVRKCAVSEGRLQCVNKVEIQKSSKTLIKYLPRTTKYYFYNAFYISTCSLKMLEIGKMYKLFF